MSAPTRIQGTAKGQGGSVASFTVPAFATPPTVGNGLVIPISLWNPATITSIADNRGNTYASAGATLGSGGAAIWFCAKVVATGSPFTITVTLGSATYYVVSAIEVSGELVLDKTVGASVTSTTPSTGATPALAGPDSFVVAVLNARSAQPAITVATVSPPWVQEYEELTTTNTAGEADSRALGGTAGTTVTAGWTLGNAAACDCRLAAFTASGGGPPPAPTVRVTHASVEAFSTASARARATQVAVEAWTPAASRVRATHLAVELLRPLLPPVRSTHAVVELWSGGAGRMRVTQTVVELWTKPLVCLDVYPRLPACARDVYPFLPAPTADVYPMLPAEECMDASTFVTNMALAEIGITKTLESLATDVSQEAYTARLVYADVLDTVLRDFPWKFATEYAALEWVGGAVGTPVNADWVYSYYLPLDCVRIRRVCEPTQQRRYTATPIPFDLRANEDGTRDLLLCNEPGGGQLPPVAVGATPVVTIEYTKRLPCAAQVNDAQFREALVYKLAARLAKGLARDSKDADRCLRNYAGALPKAQVQHANDAEPQRPITGPPDWITGR